MLIAASMRRSTHGCPSEGDRLAADATAPTSPARGRVTGPAPLLLALGLLTLGSLALYRSPDTGSLGELFVTYPPLAGLPAPHLAGWSIAYWSLALVVAVALIWLTGSTRPERLVRLALVLVAAAAFVVVASSATSLAMARLASPLVVVGLIAIATGVVDRDRAAVAAGVGFGALLWIMLWHGLGTVPWWIMPPLGGVFDPLLSPAPNVVLLAVVLLAGGGVSRRRALRDG